MQPRPSYYDSESGNRWMLSYLDVLTILLILFVAVSAQGLRSQRHPAPPPPPPPPVERPRPALDLAKRQLQQQGLDATLEPRGLVLSLPQAVLFASGEERISPDALPMVDQIAEVLRATPGKISLIGHADATPIHNKHFRSNWELSVARSLRLLELLSGRCGLPESRLSIAGFGSQEPRSPDASAEGRAANRRVEIVVLDASAL
jgi:chemotaxis protein MotB